MNQLTRLRRFLLLAGSSVLAVSSASAQTVWNGSVDGNWNVAGNWNSALASPSAGNLTFSGSLNKTNTNNAGVATIGTLTLSNGGWNIGLGGSAVNINAITATDSSTLTGNVFMGNGGSKTITLNGTNTILEITGQLNMSRANNSLDLAVNGAGNTLLVGSLNIGDGGGNKTLSGSGNVTVTGAVTETITTTFIKTNTGTLTFNGSYTSNSPTRVDAGTMLINSNASAATGDFTINSSGTLGGTGTIGGNTTVSGTYSPGVAANTVGSQGFNSKSLTFNTGSLLKWDVTNETTFDKVTGVSSLAKDAGTGGIFNVIAADITSAFWNADRTFSNVFNTGTLSDVFSGFQLNGTSLTAGLVADQGTFTFSGSSVQWTAIPEPSTALGGLLLTAGFLRRRRKGEG